MSNDRLAVLAEIVRRISHATFSHSPRFIAHLFPASLCNSRETASRYVKGFAALRHFFSPRFRAFPFALPLLNDGTAASEDTPSREFRAPLLPNRLLRLHPATFLRPF